MKGLPLESEEMRDLITRLYEMKQNYINNLIRQDPFCDKIEDMMMKIYERLEGEV